MAHLESGPLDGHHPALAPGQVLASRYRIVSFLGQGAVGEVYEAKDLELGEQIAIKILRPEIAGDERVLQRFKREIQLGRRVTHPNVCRVFDLVKPENGGAFLTMELLQGETLEQRLAREVRMSTAEALPVIGHIVAALAAAHANGVVHRDLKSGNVFLVPTASGTRAVVTDFGLAWSPIHEDASAAALTATGELVGSPAYMAPEQVRGEEATPATDIYALGVVMFEMITGELPFVGKSAFYTALKRLQEPAPSPRVHLSDLDPAWETTILRCLERDPAARFPTVRHVVRSLGATKAEEDATSPLTLIPKRRRRPFSSRIGLGAAALLAMASLAGLGIAGKLPFRREAPASPAVLSPVAAVPAEASVVVLRPSVAVLPFDNLSDPEDGSGGLPLFELLPLELAATGTLRIIPPGEVDRAVRDLGAGSVPRLHERLGADFLVSGAFLPDRYDLVVWDARTGRQLASFTEPAGPLLLEALGRRLRTALGAGELSSGQEEALRAAIPEPAPARLYAEGLHRLRRFEAPAARDLLRQAAAMAPDHPLIRAALATAWMDVGYPQEARREAKQAFALAAVLRREDRLAIQARYHELADEIPQAIAIYREITSALPDDLESGLLQAKAEIRADLGAEAEETLARLQRLPLPLGEDPRIDVAQAMAAGARRDFPRQKEAAGQAVRKAEAQGDRALAAEARLELGEAQLWLTDLEEAERTFEEARHDANTASHSLLLAQSFQGLGLVRYQQERLDAMENAYREMIAVFQRIGAEGRAADGLKQVGNLYLGAGELDQAESFYRQALAPAHRLGDRRLEAAVLHNLAKTTWSRGQLTEARELFRQTLALHREIGFARGEAASLQGIGTISKSQGDLLAAHRSFQEALAVYQRLRDAKSMPEVLNNLAEVSFALGELAQSRREREQARDLARSTRLEHEEARAVTGLADVARQQGDLATARNLYEQSLATYQRLKLTLREADTEDEIGLVLTAQGDLMEALKRFQRALATARQEDQRRAEAQVLAHQGRALWRWGELERGRTAQERAIALSREVEEPSILAEALVGLGHIQHEQGEIKEARRSFEEALKTFRGRGERSGIAAALFGLGEILLAEGELQTSRKRHQEALAARDGMGEKLAAAESRLALARVALTEDQAAAAETGARKEMAAFRSLGNAPGEAAATLLLVRALLARGKKAEAQKTLQDAARLLDASQEPAVRQATAELRGRVGGSAALSSMVSTP